MDIFNELNGLDIAILAIIIISALFSLMRGFVREILSLITWVVAFFIANRYFPQLSEHLTYFNDQLIRNSVAAVILFIVTLIIGALISHIICRMLNYTGLGGLDRILGVFFGLLRGVLIISAVVFLFGAFTPIPGSQLWKDSTLIPHFYDLLRIFFEYFKGNHDFFLNPHLLLSS